ncbi:MAG: DUF3667 domain-containing protein [Caulobacteraceae bacterium]|nr:DUF3667 domain-containing protein [Caulobacteraceae bacterium]
MSGRFCAACGMDSRRHRRRWGELVSDFLDTFYEVAVHAPRTLVALFARPQELVVGLRDGDHRYPTPFKLYVTASAIFFLFLAVSSVSIYQVFVHRVPGEPLAVTAYMDRIEARGYWLEDRFLHRRADVPRDADLVRVLTEARDASPNPNFKVSLELVRRLADDPAFINEDVEAWAPRALWLLMPLYALLLSPLFRRAPYLTDHFIFAVWAHTTLYLLLILGALWNMAGMMYGLGVALALYQVYLTVGLRAYYGAGWTGAAIKGAVHSALYAVLCWLPVIVIFFIAQIARLMSGGGE